MIAVLTDEKIGIYVFKDIRMTKEKMLEIIKKLLNTDDNLNFLLRLKGDELKVLVACIRDRVDQVGK
ncbi:MAG: hypothetical protein Q7J27_09455 [Syntrophales bacterium]|nr:hypothetical protein [Syntrophales bacterium]